MIAVGMINTAIDPGIVSVILTTLWDTNLNSEI